MPPNSREANRAIGGSASSPDPKFNHGGAESLSDTTATQTA